MVLRFRDFTSTPDSSGPRPFPSDGAVWPPPPFFFFLFSFCPKSGFVLLFQKCGTPEACPPPSCPLRGPGTLLAGLPILSFLEHILTNVPLLYKGREKCYFNKLVFGGREGGDGRETEQVDHNVVDFNIGCKITNAYNKQNIYSVLRFNVQSEFECSFLICAVGESIFVHFRVKLVE